MGQILHLRFGGLRCDLKWINKSFSEGKQIAQMEQGNGSSLLAFRLNPLKLELGVSWHFGQGQGELGRLSPASEIFFGVDKP